jgi:hypothetical protein
MPIQTAADSISNSQGSPFGFKNRIINGAMVIDQRNAGSSVTITTDNTFTLDRWSTAATAASKFSVQQSTTAATGFTNSLLATSLSAYSVGSGDIFAFKHTIEGFNVSDLGWGTANAQTVTLSFWVRSSLTGTFGGALQNGAQNRSYPFSFTINAANTFEYKTVTIAGDTSGTWLTTNGKGLLLWINLGTGSTGSGTAGAWAGATYWAPTGATSVVGTNGATFYITGVQLEKGTQATAFDYRDYGRELQLCQRYFTKLQTDGTGFAGIAVGTQGATTESIFSIGFPVQMRVEPTCTISNLDVSDVVTYSADATLNGFYAGYLFGQIRVTHSSGGAQYRPATLNIKNNTTGFLSLSAEL